MPEIESNCEVYRDGRYVLGLKDGSPYLVIDGEEYGLSCHPYEPCLYIKSKDGSLTVVHNAFDPSYVEEAFSEGKLIRSITGRKYDAKDFCRMAEYAAGKYDIGIDEAEKVFAADANEKPVISGNSEALKNRTGNEHGGAGSCPGSGSVIEDDPFYAVVSEYPDIVTDYCLVKIDSRETGLNAHRTALELACRELFFDGPGEAIWSFDTAKADALEIPAAGIMSGADGQPDKKRISYRDAFLKPPYGCSYTDGDFKRVNGALFPNGTGQLEVYEWTTDWSGYFDDGHEWWGTLCLTVYDKSLDRFAVILASATD